MIPSLDKIIAHKVADFQGWLPVRQEKIMSVPEEAGKGHYA